MQSRNITIIAVLIVALGVMLRLFLARSSSLPIFEQYRPAFLQSRSYSSAQSNNMAETPTLNRDTEQAQAEPILGLPEPGSERAQRIDLSSGSGSIKMDHLGPLVVNVDGSLARISNWDKMVESERKATLRIIGKRNKERLAALEAKEKQDAQQGSS